MTSKGAIIQRQFEFLREQAAKQKQEAEAAQEQQAKDHKKP
jgi:hypothetical protein